MHWQALMSNLLPLKASSLLSNLLDMTSSSHTAMQWQSLLSNLLPQIYLAFQCKFSSAEHPKPWKPLTHCRTLRGCAEQPVGHEKGFSHCHAMTSFAETPVALNNVHSHCNASSSSAEPSKRSHSLFEIYITMWWYVLPTNILALKHPNNCHDKLC